MNFNEFSNEFKALSCNLNIKLEEGKTEQFYKYMILLKQWNEKINLTAITDPKEIIIKHFIDSITVINDIKDGSKIIDVGTGAGFPGIPLKIINSSLDVTLVDSLNKRINFLNNVIETLKLESIKAIHSRAEDLARESDYREQYDIAISRAVAPLNILLEYLSPYIKVNGKVIAMKGNNVEGEIENSKRALKELKCTIIEDKKIFLPDESGERHIIIIQKTEKTESQYPRKAGIPRKNPL